MSVASIRDIDRNDESSSRGADVRLSGACGATRTRHSGAEWREGDFPEPQG